MRRLKLVRSETHIDFIRWRRLAFIVSCAALAISIIATAAVGLNFGIDFRGGSLVEARFAEEADIGEVRDVVTGLGLGDVAVQEFGAPTDVLIRVEPFEGEEEVEVPEGEERQGAGQIVAEALGAAYEGVEIRRIDFVGPKVSGELVQAGVTAVLLAVAVVLIYIWLRFEWQFSIGAVAALAHDVLLTIGVFSVLQLEFSLAIIAAILTIVGYSLNDTVVVFDRIRENLRRYKSSPIPEVINRSVNETLSRTVMTSVTTLIALGSLFVLGGEVLRGFTFAMIWGVIVGTYSSVFIASPLLEILGVTRGEEGDPGDAAARRDEADSIPLNPDGSRF